MTNRLRLLPGLVNAHCHLDSTDMAGLFLPPTVFTDWLKQMNATKPGWSRTDYSESWRRGARMLLGTGTNTVGDIEAVPELLHPRMLSKCHCGNSLGSKHQTPCEKG